MDAFVLLVLPFWASTSAFEVAVPASFTVGS